MHEIICGYKLKKIKDDVPKADGYQRGQKRAVDQAG